MDPDKNVNDLNKSLSSFEEIATACMGNYKFRYLNIPALFTKMELVRASERSERVRCRFVHEKKSFRRNLSGTRPKSACGKSSPF